jgi:hypothetical protein
MKTEVEAPDYKIFSGDYSRDMWDAINSAKTKSELRRALYFVCCRLQELESRITRDTPSPRHVCGDCGSELQIVRPGKYQCVNPKCVALVPRSKLHTKKG